MEFELSPAKSTSNYHKKPYKLRLLCILGVKLLDFLFYICYTMIS